MITKKIQGKQDYVDRRISICIECGSLAIEKYGHDAHCKDCGKKFILGDKIGPNL